MKKLATFLSVVAMAAVAPLARADFSISVDGTACNSGAGNPASPGGEGGICGVLTSGFFILTPTAGVTISDLSSSGTQTVANSQQFTSTLTIDNTTGAPITITIDSAMNDFTSPHTPPAVTDSFGFTLNETTGSVTASSYVACVDQGNSLTIGAGTCGPTESLTVNGAHVVSSPESQLLIPSLHPTFALNQAISLTLAPGTTVDVTASQTLSNVPEPAAILLFGTMLLGVTSVVRRKAAKRA